MSTTPDLLSPADTTALAARILDAAYASGLSAGSRIPTERTLAETYGVSRTSIRHALVQLQVGGLLTRQVGRGTFLRSPDEPTVPGVDAMPLTEITPSDVMVVRSLLEPQAMDMVVAHATTREIDEMQRCALGGDAAETHDEFESWDEALHRAIMCATHNPLLIYLYEMVETARHGQLWGELKRRHDSSEQRASYQNQHHDIVDAIRARDSAAATTAMRNHLDHVSKNIFGPTPINS